MSDSEPMFTPAQIREEADCFTNTPRGEMLAAMLRQGAEDRENLSTAYELNKATIAQIADRMFQAEKARDRLKAVVDGMRFALGEWMLGDGPIEKRMRKQLLAELDRLLAHAEPREAGEPS